MSLREVANDSKLSTGKIKKILTESGIKIRTRGEQQSIEFKIGKRKKALNSEETKQKISESTAMAWRGISEEKRQDLVEKARQRWNNIPESKRDEMLQKAHERIRETANEGSALENAILEALRANDYHAKHHIKNIIPNEKLEVDILIPELTTVIEIDGLSHFEPIWGQEAFVRTQSADNRKNGLLLNNGYILIRLKCKFKHLSQFIINQSTKIILEELALIKKEAFPRQPRLIEKEVE